MGNEELYDKIEAYLSKQMTPEEVAAFRKELETNPDLAAELALHQGMAEAMQEEEELEDLGKKMSAIIKKKGVNTAETSKKNRFTLSLSFRSAAAVTLLILAALAAYFYFKSNPSTTQELYAQFIDYPASIYEEQVLRTGDPSSLEPTVARLDSLWKKADQQYQEENIEEALALLVEIETLEMIAYPQASSRLYFYRGIMQAKAELFSAAVASLEQVKTNYTEEANWKKALLLLHMENRREEAVSIIRSISTSSSPRKEDALKLLDTLSSMD